MLASVTWPWRGEFNQSQSHFVEYARRCLDWAAAQPLITLPDGCTTPDLAHELGTIAHQRYNPDVAPTVSACTGPELLPEPLVSRAFVDELVHDNDLRRSAKQLFPSVPEATPSCSHVRALAIEVRGLPAGGLVVAVMLVCACRVHFVFDLLESLLFALKSPLGRN
jgi:hypothetical protein